MTLTSLSFYLLVLALLVLYYLVPKRFQWVVLLIGSYAFYAFVCLRYMGFIVVTTLTTYFGARGMDAMTARMEQTVAAHKQDWEREERKAYKKRCKSRRKALMIAILLLNFGILAVLKYYNFFAESVQALFASVGLTVSLGHIGLLLPLGISFYTFQSMGYVLDVYREKVPAERNVGKLALFVSFFPQIIQGPIGVYDQLAHQLYDEHKYHFDNIRFGAQLILWGFFKKLVIADRAAVLVNAVIKDNCPYGGAVIASGILFYCIQLYCDFSGGIDITRGVARLFGIDMAENFRRPIFATSLTDYWRRWHITLGAWMRDYVFYPISLSRGFGKLSRWARTHIGGTAGKIFATSLATFIVYFIIGTKVKKPGAILIYSIVRAIMGGYLPYIILFILSGAIAELLLWKMGYGNAKALTVSYVINQVLAAFGSTIIPYAIAAKAMADQMVTDGRQDAILAASQMLQSWVSVALVAGVIVAAFIGAMIGKRIVKKHLAA